MHARRVCKGMTYDLEEQVEILRQQVEALTAWAKVIQARVRDLEAPPTDPMATLRPQGGADELLAALEVFSDLSHKQLKGKK